MKKLLKITRKSLIYSLSIVLLTTIGFLWSCSEDEDPIEAPIINAIVPGSGMVGSEVTITGTNFAIGAASNTVSFNGTAATVIAANSMALMTSVPEGATTGDVIVTSNGKISNGFNFTVTVPIVPTITSIDPTSGAIGDIITITGTDFSTTPEDNEVSFNGAIAIVTESTATTIKATVPTTASTGNITVTVDGETSNGIMFTFMGTPVFTINRHISTDYDDAEEGAINGAIAATSSDLELGEYDTWTQNDIEQGLQTIGIKFDTIAVPTGATILEAYIQFTCDNTGDTAVQLTIYGEDNSNPAIYDESIFYDISTRTKTTASAVWDIPEWVNEGDAGDAQKTVNLASIVQEIVNREDWASGSSMAFIMVPSGPSEGYTSSSNGREAEADFGDDSAELIIVYK
jgi:hypothetical protein